MKIIYITKKFRELVESYLLHFNPKQEHGGWFLGRDDTLHMPLILPNAANDTTNSYLPPNNWQSILELTKRVYNLNCSIHFHTHPNHSVISGDDLKVAMSTVYGNPLILLQYDEENKKYSWKGFSSFEEWKIVEIDKTFDEFKEYYARSLGLTNLGNIYITDDLKLLSDKVEGKIFLMIDEDTFNVYTYLKDTKFNSWDRPTYTSVAGAIGFTVARLKKSLEKLNKSGLFVNFFK